MGKRALKDIQVGDRVWVEYDRSRIICTVTRLTAKQIVTDWPWGKEGARFYRGALSRYDGEPHYRKIGYSGWHGSEIQSIATRTECEAYDAERRRKADEAKTAAEKRQEREAHKEQLQALFGRRMVGVYEGHHNSKAEWLIHINLTTQGLLKLQALLESLTDEELPSWEEN